MDIIDLLNKMKEVEETKTERGIVKSEMKDTGLTVSITHELEEINWKDPDVEKLVSIIEEIPFDDPYAQTYQDNIKQAYVLHGREGVKTQLLYIISNVNDKRLKDLLEFMNSKI